MLIAAVVTLWGSNVLLALHLRKVYTSQAKERKEDNKILVQELTKNTMVISNNNKLYGRLINMMDEYEEKS